MSETLLIWTEIIFDVLYLATIWIIVGLMFYKKSNLSNENNKIGLLFIAAFLLLALGDTGHVGFRVLAYGLGGLDKNPVLVGLGKLATAITVTFFYMIIAEIWRIRFKRERGMIWWSLIITGIIRLIIMVPAANKWGSIETPFSWSIMRNIPLMVQGIGVASLMLADSIKYNDKFIKKVSIMIFMSYVCYAPVILFVQKIPMLGMLMIPKTMAYVAVAVIAYSMFKKNSKRI